MKKSIFLLLAIVMMCSMCFTATAEASTPITYTIMQKYAYPEYPADGGEAKTVMQEMWEKNLGITDTDYNILLFAGSDYDTKLNTLIASGDIPDYFYCSLEQFQTFVRNGIIAPIDEYVADMPHYNALRVDTAQQNYDNFTYEGKHYCFTEVELPGELNRAGTGGVIVRTDWLNKLGLAEPVTLDDMHNVLHAFRYDDPDGNGADDTYGIGGSVVSKMFSSVFGAYGIYMNGATSWMLQDGKLVHSTVADGVKDVLTVLQQWYKEDLIDPDMFIIEDQQAQSKYIAGNFGVWENTVWSANNARVAWDGAGDGFLCNVVAPPTGPEGKMGYPVNPVKSFGYVMSTKCAETKDPARLCKILDWMLNLDADGGFMTVTYGLEGTHYSYDPQTDMITYLTNDFSELYKAGFSNPIRLLPATDRRWIAKDDPRAIDFSISNNLDNWILSAFSGSVPAMDEYPDLFTGLWTTYFTKIVTGALPVDAYDEYVKEFYEQGGQEMTDQANEALAAM
ncbi:MAG: extracellular solute-binding protein [Eubacteriales bacterium]|nr:extracellular solute-binding protein [Eubacteriales bacterium]